MLTLDQFLAELFAHYPTEKEDVKGEIEYYHNALQSEKQYNYDKLLKLVSREYTYKHTPLTSWLLDKRNTHCEVRDNPDSQHLILITFENGNTMQCTANGFGNHIHTAKQMMEDLYGAIKKVQHFPAGTVIIGQNVYYPSGKMVKLSEL